VFTLDQWWIGLISLGMTAIVILLAWRLKKSPVNLSFRARINSNQDIKKIIGVINSVTNLEWLTRTIEKIYRSTSKVILTSTAIIEGEGGILWAFVFLILLLSFLKVGGLE